jgi:drug/metabolite transporter (DMT)-like permease
MREPLGIAFVLTFVLLSAVNGVYMSAFLVDVDVFVALFCVFSFIALCFNVYVLRHHGLLIVRLPAQVLVYLALSNVTTALNWFSFFFAVKYIEPAISATLINSVLPLTTMIISMVILNDRRKGPAEWGSAAALFVAMVLTALTVFSGNSGRPASGVSSYAIGVGMSLICGVSMALNTVVSKKLNQLEVKPSTIMAYRFFLLIALSLLLVDLPAFERDVARVYPQLLLIAVVGNMLPLFALQLGIQRLSPVTVVFLNGLGPMAHFAVQGFSSHLQFSWASLAAIAVSTCVILVGAWISHRTREGVVATSSTTSRMQTSTVPAPRPDV